MTKKTQQKNSTGEKGLIMGSHQQFQTPPRGQNWETALSSFLGRMGRREDRSQQKSNYISNQIRQLTTTHSLEEIKQHTFLLPQTDHFTEYLFNRTTWATALLLDTLCLSPSPDRVQWPPLSCLLESISCVHLYHLYRVGRMLNLLLITPVLKLLRSCLHDDITSAQ